MITRVSKTGFVERQLGLMRRLEQAGQLKPALEALGRDVVAEYERNIGRGRGSEGKFAKLSEPYGTRKLKKWGPRPILVASGAMAVALSSQVRQLGPARYVMEAGVDGSVDMDGVKNGDKATWHVEGTPRMPKRNFAALGKRFLDARFVELFKTTRQAVTAPASTQREER